VKILTANRLRDGEVVWLAADGSWTVDIAGARIAGGEAAEASLLGEGVRAMRNNEVVDVDLVAVEISAGTIRPLRLRERIRATGPTSRLDLGKQAAARPGSD
jgi:hypothetical protein